MNWITAIGWFIQLVVEMFTTIRATNQERKEERKKLEEEAREAIRSRDASRINDIFNRLRNL